MVQRKPLLDRSFRALADPTRRAIVDRLVRAETLSVSEIAAPFSMSLPAVQKHLRVLEQAGLIACAKSGRVRRCQLRPGALAPAHAWVRDRAVLWQARLERLAAHLEEGGSHG